MPVYILSLAALVVVAVINIARDRRSGERTATTARGVFRLLVIQVLFIVAAWMTWSRLGGRFDGDLVTMASLNVALIGITRGQLLSCLTPGETKNEKVLRRAEREPLKRMVIESLIITGIALGLGIWAEWVLYP